MRRTQLEGRRDGEPKFTADDPTPLMPETHEKTIREIPRDPEVSEPFKKLIRAEPMPSRWLLNM